MVIFIVYTLHINDRTHMGKCSQICFFDHLISVGLLCKKTCALLKVTVNQSITVKKKLADINKNKYRKFILEYNVSIEVFLLDTLGKFGDWNRNTSCNIFIRDVIIITLFLGFCINCTNFRNIPL